MIHALTLGIIHPGTVVLRVPLLYKASYMLLPYSKAMGEEQSCQMPGSKEELEILARGTSDDCADI